MTTAKKDGESRQGAMTAAVNDIAIARQYLARTENLIAKQQRKPVEKIRPVVASRLQMTVSSLDFIRRDRRKFVPSWLKTKIVELFIETAETELRAIQHEIEVARQIGLDPLDGKLLEAKARAAALFEVLDDATSGRRTADPRG